MRPVLQTRIARALNQQRPSPERQREQLFTVTLFLDGITPDDYMQWIRDPEPPNRDDLKLVTATATALGDIQLELLSTGDPPPAVAASAVGLPITPEVIELHSRVIDAPTHRRDAAWSTASAQPTFPRPQPGGAHNSPISGHAASSTSQPRLPISSELRSGMNAGQPPPALVRSIRRPGGATPTKGSQR